MRAGDIKVERWQRRLFDLSRRNRLLHFKPTRQSIQITAPSPAQIFTDLVGHERRLDFPKPLEDIQFALVDDDDATSLAGLGNNQTPVARGYFQTSLNLKDLNRALDKNRLQSLSSIAEQGVNTLFLALGMLEWREARSATSIERSPLLLIPVSIEQQEEGRAFRLGLFDGDIEVNPTLRFKMQEEFRITLPEFGDDVETAELDEWLDRVRATVRGEGWTVAPESWVAQFSYLKLAMFHDLQAHRQQIEEHPVVRALAGFGSLSATGGDMPELHDLDKALDRDSSVPPLDADSSQLEALVRVRAGQHLVIDGPPGTGKSQTIANIIADQLGAGKKVLFVSEKMAALEVVHDRLRRIGLGPFCLEVHSHRANKRVVVEQLGNALLGNEPLPRLLGDDGFAELRERRAHLNAYVKALHEPRDRRGRTAFRVHGELASLRAMPDIDFALPLAAAATIAPEDEDAIRSAVRRIGLNPELLRGYATHPWRDSVITSFSLELQERVRAQLTSVATLIDGLLDVLPQVSRDCGLDCPTSLEGAGWLLGTSRLVVSSPLPPGDWFVRSSLQPLLEDARSYKEQFDQWHAVRQDLLRWYTPALFEVPAGAVAEALRSTHQDALARVKPTAIETDVPAVARRAALAEYLTRLLIVLPRLTDELRELASACGLVPPTSLEEAALVAQTASLVATDPRPLPTWLEWSALQTLQVQAQDTYRRQQARQELRTDLDETFKVGIFDLDAAEWLKRFHDEYGGLLRGLRRAYKRDISTLRNLLREPANISYENALAHLNRLSDYQQMVAWADAQRPHLATAFGMHFRGDQTDWPSLLRAVETVQELLHLHGGRLPDDILGQALVQSGAPVRAIRARWEVAAADLEAVRDSLGQLQQHAALGGLLPEAPVLTDANLNELRAALGGLSDSLHAYWRAYDTVCATLQAGVVRDSMALVVDVERTARVQGLERQINDQREQLIANYGAFFVGMETAWDEVIAALGWTGNVQARFPGGQPPFAFIRAVTENSDVPVSVKSVHDRLAGLLGRVPAERVAFHTIFPNDVLIDGQPFHRADLRLLRSWTGDRLSAIGRIQEWVDFLELQEICARHGLGDFLRIILERGIPAEYVEPVFRRRFLTRWLDEVYRAVPELGRFRREEHEFILGRFQQLDRDLRSAVTSRIARRVDERRPKVAATASPVAESELGVVLREARKRTRHMPLRRLFERAPHLLLDLKPCLLMGPLAVASYLRKGQFAFDLVIFDEASQIAPEDAIGAMLRGRQVVIAGDEKQLPPTAFFTPEDQPDPEDEEAAFDSLESILDECASLANMNRTGLRWHYRSRHESLIAFSNDAFYRNHLITFPSPLAESGSAGVRFVHVSAGVWDRGKSRTNAAEARCAADLIFEHFEQSGGSASLGVITLNQAQADRIRDEVRARRRERRDFEELFNEDAPEPFFIKSIESVQGDERDHIILSIGYGPDANGMVALNFGPINREGGERRLNVAVTRAKWRLTLVASMQPEHMDLARLNRPNRGVELLQRYLYYVRDGRLPVEAAPLEREPDSPFEVAVIEALHREGLDVIPQVGCSGFRIDIGVKDPERPGRFLLGVECDGATYHSARTARDRDRLRQEVLEGLGWRIHRIWSTDWVRDPAGEIGRVLEAVARARMAATDTEEPASVTEPAAPVEVELEPVAQPTNSNGVVADGARALTAMYRPFEPKVTRQPDRLYDGSNDQIAEDVQQVVEAEGPIHEGILIQRVARIYGVARAGNVVQQRVRAGMAAAVRRGQIVRRGEFFWPVVAVGSDGDLCVTPRQPTLGDAARPIDQIAPEEIRAAAALIVAENYQMPRETLVQETARWLGYQRITERILAAIEVALTSRDERGERAG